MRRRRRVGLPGTSRGSSASALPAAPQWQASPCAPPAGTRATGVRDRYLGQNHHPVIFHDDVNAKVALFDFKLLVLARRVFGGWGLSAWRSMPPSHPGPLPITYRFHLAAAAATLASAGSSLLAEGRKSLSPSLLGAFVSLPTRRLVAPTWIPLPWLRINRANCLQDLRVARGGHKIIIVYQLVIVSWPRCHCHIGAVVWKGPGRRA